MTINKSQGQSLTHVGVVFSHSRLYVALSRATDVRNISILIQDSNIDEVTDNIVYPEVLQDKCLFLFSSVYLFGF